MDTNKIDFPSPLNLKKSEIPKQWNSSESVKKEDLNQKRPTLLNCPGCGAKLEENDLEKQSCSFCGYILDN